jgi:hypothetical protein
MTGNKRRTKLSAVKAVRQVRPRGWILLCSASEAKMFRFFRRLEAAEEDRHCIR